MALELQHQVSLQDYNSMAVPATARCLVSVDDRAQAQAALDYARVNALDVLVLGEGSNTLFKGDFEGLVILNRIRGIEILGQTESTVTLRVGAGENWHDFVAYTLDNDWFGLQNLALIPGLVGAAPMQNIGAYGVEVKDYLTTVEYLDIATGQPYTLSRQACQFGYRDSIFKHELAFRALVSAVNFTLSKTPSVDISYPALASLFDKKPTPKEVFLGVCKVRQSKLPLPSMVPNAGSFFKNPVVAASQHEKLKQQYPDLVSFEMGEQFKLAAGWLIEQAGWKNRELDTVRVHQSQALVVVNPEKRSGTKVLEFAALIQTDIKHKFDVDLEIEPQVYGV